MLHSQYQKFAAPFSLVFSSQQLFQSQKNIQFLENQQKSYLQSQFKILKTNDNLQYCQGGLSTTSRIPTKGSEKAAGYDLYSNQAGVVPAHGKLLVKTGISVQIPVGNYGRIAPRSGLALKYSIDVGAGVIDEDYRGEVCVLLFNFSNEDFLIKEGDRISQLIIEKITETTIEEVDELDSTVRNQAGFGSTDAKQSKTNH